MDIKEFNSCAFCGAKEGEVHKVYCRERQNGMKADRVYIDDIEVDANLLPKEDDGNMRSFDTGATRDTGEGKLDYSGFLCPYVLEQYAKFMNMNRLQSDGKLRDADNWQKGIPTAVYVSSSWRHYWEFWKFARLFLKNEFGWDRCIHIALMAGACGLLFNIMGYMHEYLKNHPVVDFDGTEPTLEMAERQRKVKEMKR
jgi:hypothetical protein